MCKNVMKQVFAKAGSVSDKRFMSLISLTGPLHSTADP